MESSNWAMLPKHLLDSVLERLPSRLDYLQFSVVCMSWNSVAEDNLKKRTTPMLLAYTGKEDTWNLYDIACEKILDLQLDLPNRRFCGFSKEWLITIDENFTVTLINPFSRVKGRIVEENSFIKLPALNLTEKSRKPWGPKVYVYYVHKATISANPISNAKDCIVMIIHGQRCQLAFIRLNKDTRWTYIDENIQQIMDVVYVEDRFYALSHFNQLFCVEVTAEGFNSYLVGEALEEPLSVKNRYLVESSDHKELLMIHRFLYHTGPPRSRRSTMKFEVFKYDVDKHKWIKINSLGDNALFVGENSSILVLASYFRCLPNCIYFLHDWDRQSPPPRPRDSGVYDITNQCFLRLGHARALIKMSNRTPIWTMASIKL